MTRSGREARAVVVRGLAYIAAVLAFVLVSGTVGAAAVEVAPQYQGKKQPVAAAAATCEVGQFKEGLPAPKDPTDIQACVKRLAFASSNPNAISIDVPVTDKKTGLPPAVDYSVYLVAHPPGNVDISAVSDNPTPCQQAHYFTNPEYARGVYRCSWDVTGPGKWVFDVTINKSGTVQHILKISKTLDITDAVAQKGLNKGLKYVVEGRTFEVFLLQAHMAAASMWLLLVTVMAFLALPRLRRMCSVLTLHTLEVRRGFLTSVMWAMFLATVGSGIYLLRTQTAYKAPFSKSAWDNITKLPYAQTYFTTLYLKILVFTIMAAASVVLMLEAARQARLAGDVSPDSGRFDDDDDMWGHSNIHLDDLRHDDDVSRSTSEASARTAVRAQPRADTTEEGPTQRTLWTCVLIVAGGMGAIGVCVTILKYTHELIEMTVASKTILGK